MVDNAGCEVMADLARVMSTPPIKGLHHRLAKLIVNSTDDEKVYSEMAGLYAPK